VPSTITPQIVTINATVTSAPSPSTLQQSVGTEPDNVTLTIVEALLLSQISREDILGHRYEGARVWVYEVNYLAPYTDWTILNRYFMAKATLGDSSMKVMLVDLLYRLKQSTGRIMGSSCDVQETFDIRCDPTQTLKALNSYSRTVIWTIGSFTVDFGGDSNVSDFYSFGKVEWTAGANDNLFDAPKQHTLITPATWAGGTTYALGDYAIGSDTHVYVSLEASNTGHNPTSTTGHWQRITSDPSHVARIVFRTPPNFPVVAGDEATLVRGCRKDPATCKAIANSANPSGTNIENFQGFSLPLNDDLIKVGRQPTS